MSPWLEHLCFRHFKNVRKVKGKCFTFKVQIRLRFQNGQPEGILRNFGKSLVNKKHVWLAHKASHLCTGRERLSVHVGESQLVADFCIRITTGSLAIMLHTSILALHWQWLENSKMVSWSMPRRPWWLGSGVTRPLWNRSWADQKKLIFLPRGVPFCSAC